MDEVETGEEVEMLGGEEGEVAKYNKMAAIISFIVLSIIYIFMPMIPDIGRGAYFAIIIISYFIGLKLSK